MEELKDLKELSYTSVVEALGERFHMSPELLRALNPGSRFDKPGETINVTDVAADAILGQSGSHRCRQITPDGESAGSRW